MNKDCRNNNINKKMLKIVLGRPRINIIMLMAQAVLPLLSRASSAASPRPLEVEQDDPPLVEVHVQQQCVLLPSTSSGGASSSAVEDVLRDVVVDEHYFQNSFLIENENVVDIGSGSNGNGSGGGSSAAMMNKKKYFVKRDSELWESVKEAWLSGNAAARAAYGNWPSAPTFLQPRIHPHRDRDAPFELEILSIEMVTSSKMETDYQTLICWGRYF